jgi:hypothetical protein
MFVFWWRAKQRTLGSIEKGHSRSRKKGRISRPLAKLLECQGHSFKSSDKESYIAEVKGMKEEKKNSDIFTHSVRVNLFSKITPFEFIKIS